MTCEQIFLLYGTGCMAVLMAIALYVIIREVILINKNETENCKRIKKFSDCPASPTAETCKGRCSSWF